ncbi:MAG: sulfur oxidation c-type cytochrome SoxX [Burkholderiales bacterium]|nr:sulfur oxidation c-type cytochrome SoxX [Sulfuricellaceae bacterium]
MRRIKAALLIAGVLSASCLAQAQDATHEETGQSLAFDNKKGNCLACHAIPNAHAEMPGNIAPPLLAMKLRYPDKSKLRAQIWDATIANPKTSMPPFGKHKILTEEEIDKVTDFIYSM